MPKVIPLKPEPAAQTTYQEHTITLTKSFRFEITGPLVEHSHTTDSIEQARAYIDRRAAAVAKQKKTKIALAVVGDDGRKGTVTGIHAGTGNVLGIESYNLYPDVPWIVAILNQRARPAQAAGGDRQEAAVIRPASLAQLRQDRP